MEQGDYLLIDESTGKVIAISGNSAFDDMGVGPVRHLAHKHFIAIVQGEEE